MSSRVHLYIALLAVVGLVAQGEPGIMPLAEVKPGMTGEFRTVVQGTEIRSYPIRIVGVMEHFIGPQRAIIWAEALDDDNLLFGPVSGMSGSPVFVDGRLIGAYAYGYPFAKEQALIGIQPIESMLEISRLHPADEPGLRLPSPAPMDSRLERAQLSRDGRHALPPVDGDADAWRWASGGRPTSGDAGAGVLGGWSSLPMPLMVGGFSARTLDFFRPYLKELGLDLQGAAVGASREEITAKLEPGAALAGVLMTGDFRAAGVGTVTYRDGDDVLGFGHSFFQHGPTEIPMAPAEIVTIVQSVASSFKLSSVGPVVGAIHQDRLTGIKGQIGRPAHMIDLSVTVKAPGAVRRTYRGELFQHRQLSPILAAMVMMESLFSTLETESEQTIRSSVTLNLKGREPIVKRDVAGGRDGPMRLILDFLSVKGNLMNNPFSFPEVKSVHFEFELEDSWNQQILRQVAVESGVPRAGEELEVRLIMQNFRGDPEHRVIRIPIPDGTSGEVLEVDILDAQRLHRGWSNSGGGAAYQPRPDARDLDDLIREIRERRGYEAIYVRVYRRAEGVRMRGMDLNDLPPSFMASIASPKTAEVMQRSERALIWEGTYPTPGEFRGFYRFSVEVRH